MPLISSELAQSIGTITLNNSAKRNALCMTLVGEIIDVLAGFELEKARVVVLRAAPGVKVWSSGHDIDELPKGRRDPDGTTPCGSWCGAWRPFPPRSFP
jgi:methylmalonyl-CoA decarboxylase